MKMSTVAAKRHEKDVLSDELSTLDFLMTNPELILDPKKARPLLEELVQMSLQQQLGQESGDATKKLTFKNFEPAQIWQQLVHFTEKANNKALDKIGHFI